MLTLAGPSGAVEEATREVARVVVDRLDLSGHAGVHPRIGTLDVVPFVALAPGGPATKAGGPLSDGTTLVPGPPGEAVAARDRFAAWAGTELGLPCFLYGPLLGPGSRTLPEIRRGAFRWLAPDTGPDEPHRRAGGCAVGARPVLIAYNVWLSGIDVAAARRVAASLRGPAVRALGLDLGPAVQVSCNLVEPWTFGPAMLVDRLRALLRDTPARVERCELVGLLPAGVLFEIPRERWAELDLSPERTIEAQLREKGVSWR